MSALRYPGGKTRAVKQILPYFPEDRNYASPFLGGGSIELALTKYGKVYGYDIFPPLVHYWQNLIKSPVELGDIIESYHPVTKKSFYKLREDILEEKEDKINIAAKYFVLNRSSFSGTALSGGFSKEAGKKRFTKSSIKRVRNFNNKNISVKCLDFTKSIPKHKNDILYLDPPYYSCISSKLYGKNGELQQIDHKKLFDILDNRDDWILSYDDCDYIRDLYSEYYMINPKWSYGMSKNKKSKEVLILSPSIQKYNKL